MAIEADLNWMKSTYNATITAGIKNPTANDLKVDISIKSPDFGQLDIALSKYASTWQFTAEFFTQ